MLRDVATARVPWHRRLLEQFLDFLVPTILYLYARLWHRCAPARLDPLFPRGAALVIANHPSHADPAFLMAGCRRWIHFLQAREYYDVCCLRPFFHLFGCIPVRRGGSDPSGIRMALERLRRGAVVGIFPEGDLTPPARTGCGKAIPVPRCWRFAAELPSSLPSSRGRRHRAASWPTGFGPPEGCACASAHPST